MRKTSAPAVVYLYTLVAVAAGAAYVTLRVADRRGQLGAVRHRDVAELDTVVMESAARRRLMESHLRDQLDAEVESRVEDALVEGFAIGWRAHGADGCG